MNSTSMQHIGIENPSISIAETIAAEKPTNHLYIYFFLWFSVWKHIQKKPDFFFFCLGF